MHIIVEFWGGDPSAPPSECNPVYIHAWLHTKLTSNSFYRGTHTDRQAPETQAHLRPVLS